jgi:hypothetical protein
MSLNPATGLVYIPTSSISSFTFQIDQDFKPKPGQNMGIIFGRGGFGGPPAPGAAPPPPPAAARPSPAPIGPAPVEGQRGILVAWDPVNQRERWKAPGGGGIGGGTVTTAGNLVFQVIPDGRLVAYSADKGEKLLDVQTGLRGGMGPPITYQLDGKQYVSLMGGTGRVVFNFPGGGGAAPAGRGGANATPAPPDGAPPDIAAPGGVTPPAGRGGGPAPVLPKLLTFVLDGKAPLPTAPPATTPATP